MYRTKTESSNRTIFSKVGIIKQSIAFTVGHTVRVQCTHKTLIYAYFAVSKSD